MNRSADSGNGSFDLQAPYDMQRSGIDNTALSAVGVDGGKCPGSFEMVSVAYTDCIACAREADHGFDRVAAKASSDQRKRHDAGLIKVRNLLGRVMAVANSFKNRFKAALLASVDFDVLKTFGFRKPIIEVVHQIVQGVKSLRLYPRNARGGPNRHFDRVANALSLK